MDMGAQQTPSNSVSAAKHFNQVDVWRRVWTWGLGPIRFLNSALNAIPV